MEDELGAFIFSPKSRSVPQRTPKIQQQKIDENMYQEDTRAHMKMLPIATSVII